MIDILAVYSAFGIKNSSEIKKFIANRSQENIPEKEIFGIFTTIIRSQVLENWPTDIHGCLGYWTHNYQKMTPREIIKKITELSYNTNHYDNRRKYFPKSLSEDRNALIELSFMLLPVLEVSEHGIVNGKIFDNKQMGLIVENGDKRSTYLAGVFPNMEWDKLRSSLMKKGEIQNGGKFFAYKTQTIKCPIYKTIFSKLSSKLLEFDVANFFRAKYTSFIPYAYKNGTVIIDKNQNVRNISTIGDVIRFSKIYNFEDKMEVIKRNLEWFYEKYLANPLEMRQASAFLIENYHMLKLYPDRVKKMSDYLYKNMENLEPRFELGEVLTVLSKIKPHNNFQKNIFNNESQKMIHRLQNMNPDLEDVFELNWQSHFVESSNIDGRKDHAEKIWKLLDEIIVKWMEKNNSKSRETNYLAVVYECLSNLENILGDKIRDRRLEFFIKLSSRRGDYGLYYFLGMEEARLDITGHIIFK